MHHLFELVGLLGGLQMEQLGAKFTVQFAATLEKAKQGDLSFVIRGGSLEVEQLPRDSATAQELLLGFCARLGVDRVIDGVGAAGELVLEGIVWVVVILQLTFSNKKQASYFGGAS